MIFFQIWRFCRWWWLFVDGDGGDVVVISDYYYDLQQNLVIIFMISVTGVDERSWWPDLVGMNNGWVW